MIERQKRAIPTQPQDTKTLSSQEAAQKNLFETIRALVAEKKMSRAQGNMATIYLLSDPVLGLASEDQLLQKYSKKEIDDAIASIDEDVEAGTTLGKRVMKLRAQMEGAQSMVSETPKEVRNETFEEQLIRLANITFNSKSDGLDGNERRVQEKLAWWAVVHIARWSLHKTPEEVSAITKLAPSTVVMTIKNAREEYAGRDTFYEKVNLICKELDIPMP